MAPDMLDIGFANADPAVTAADVKAAGARAVGLYPINLSAPSTVVSADYALAVAAAGVQVVPIITPGQNPPPVSGVPDALKAWGQLNADNVVVFDIEQWGIDTPPLDWVIAFRDTLNGAGYHTWIYTNIALYEVATWWAVDWNHGDQAAIPPGAVAVQFGIPWVGSQGNSYDQSYLLPNVLGGNDMWNANDEQMLQEIHQTIQGGLLPQLGVLTAVKAELDALKAEVDAAPGSPQTAGVAAAVARIEAALKQA